ncbi:MAG TPA: M56 family metallopeptidase [Dinghuibacter sp.]|uniref:M56 family metallopeptidase n=1 Tax=Dinghuibacter sp. TaxID=2024697 RepID=UPI002CE5F9C7|nr:M56 family metallopeptidase [Dinghuibacter sp.]HTJ10610.1 M56 family metallopeptidase [Dinghuibacter sp.]
MNFPIHALCWTLIHSLWEGLIAAVLAGAVLLTTRRSSAALRYQLLTLIFFGLVAAVGVTFVWLLPHESTEVATAGRNVVLHFGGATPVQHAAVAVPAPLWQRVSGFFDRHATAIVWIWLLVLAAKLTQTGLSLAHVRRLKRRRVHAAGAEWSERVRALGSSLGLRRTITLLESGLIRVPMVIGYLKPVILVPVGILAQLPQDQLEAVLLHELAHIRRRDYMVNLIQGIVEAALFFNPAVWWISSLIREERENCCDDIAIRATASKAQLIHALVAFQEYSLAAPAFAVAFPGRRNPLLDRVKRIVYNRNKTLNAMEKLFLTGCLVVATCLTLAFTPFGQRHLLTRDTIPPAPPVAPVPPVAVATTPAPPAALPGAPAGAAAAIAPPTPPAAGAPTVDAPAIPAMAPALTATTPVSPIAPATAPAPPVPPIPDTSTIPDNEFEHGTFRGTLDMQNHKITYARGIWRSENGNTVRYYLDNKKVVQENGVTTAYYVEGRSEDISSHAGEIDDVISTLKASEKKSSTVTLDSSPGASYTESGSQVSGSGYTMSSGGSGSSSVSGSGTVGSGSFDIHTGKNGSATVGPERVTVNGSNTSATLLHYTGKTDDANSPILEDIFSQKLADNPDNVSFALDAHHMTINGKRQPNEVFQAFKAKYIHHNGDGYTYKRENGDTSSIVSQRSSN